MTPKEKAKELIDKMLNEQSNTEEIYDAKQCALIAVDEILNFIEDDRNRFNWKTYYKQVKQEIEKL